MRVAPGLRRHEIGEVWCRQVVARLPSGRKVISCHLHKSPEGDSFDLIDFRSRRRMTYARLVPMRSIFPKDRRHKPQHVFW